MFQVNCNSLFTLFINILFKWQTFKVAQKILEVACNDRQFSVQESAIGVLGLMCKHEKARKVDYKQKNIFLF